MNIPLAELRNRNPGETMHLLIQSQNRLKIVLGGDRHAGYNIRPDMSEVRGYLQHALDGSFVTTHSGFEQIVGKLRVAEFILGDKRSDLTKHWFTGLMGQPKKEISGEVLTDHVEGEFAYGILDRVLNVAVAYFNKLSIRDRPVAHNFEV